MEYNINNNIKIKNMNALDSYNLGRDAAFRNRVRSLLMKVATQALSDTSLAQPALDKTYALAIKILEEQQDSRFYEQAFSMVIPAWGSLTPSPSDDDIYSELTSKFNAVAGVTAQDLTP